MFTAKDPGAELGALAWLMVHDEGLRQKIVAAQRQRRTAFLPSAVAPQLMALVAGLMTGQNAPSKSGGDGCPQDVRRSMEAKAT
jgi:hypothetical protein